MRFIYKEKFQKVNPGSYNVTIAMVNLAMKRVETLFGGLEYIELRLKALEL
jgi:hypothetical protein